MNIKNELLNSVEKGNFKRFVSLLKKSTKDDVFIESEDFSIWHLIAYEPVSSLYIKEIFKRFKDESIDMDIAVKRGDRKGQTAYMIATSFAMKDKMDFLAKKGADASIVNKIGKKSVSAIKIAEQFFGGNSIYGDHNLKIIKTVQKHTSQSEKKNIKKALGEDCLEKLGKRKNKII